MIPPENKSGVPKRRAAKGLFDCKKKKRLQVRRTVILYCGNGQPRRSLLQNGSVRDSKTMVVRLLLPVFTVPGSLRKESRKTLLIVVFD